MLFVWLVIKIHWYCPLEVHKDQTCYRIEWELKRVAGLSQEHNWREMLWLHRKRAVHEQIIKHFNEMKEYLEDYFYRRMDLCLFFF